MKILTDQVTIPPDRFRKGIGDSSKAKQAFADLKDSLTRNGLINPVTVSHDNTLIAGFRRFTAALELGWKEIPCTIQDELTEYQRREIELEENLFRLDMSPAEEQKAIAELHRLKTAENPNWTQTSTAVATQKHRTQVVQAIKLDSMLKLFPDLAKAKSVNQMVSWANSKAKTLLRKDEVQKNPVDYSAIESRLILGDSREVVKSIPSDSFRLILTDPPFGLNYDEGMAGVASASAYSDTQSDYESLLAMAPELYRVLKPDGFLIWFLGISWYERAKTSFRSAGFVVDEIPIIWDRSDGKTWTQRPDRYFGRGYDIALHCIKGSPEIVQRGKSNIIRCPPVSADEKELLVERPIGLYAELIRRLTVPGETVADFFAGSGSCPAAAESIGRQWYAVEQDPDRRLRALAKIHAHTPKKKGAA